MAVVRAARAHALARRAALRRSRVSIGGRDGVKPHHAVRIGDVVVVELPHQRRRLIVRALGERRGPPAEAKLLYDEPTPPVALETPAPGWVSLFEDEWRSRRDRLAPDRPGQPPSGAIRAQSI